MKSKDGRFDLMVNIYRPSDFDPDKRYPLLDHVYALACCQTNPPAYPIRSPSTHHQYFWQAQATAELGFIVITIDGRGTRGRDSNFTRASYGAAMDDILADHAYVARSLADTDPSIDGDRIGAFGSSGGGYAATRLMLLYPDTYKVGVASAGSHDLVRLYTPDWGDRYVGLYEDNKSIWDSLSNSSIANRLEGKLLLAHGGGDSDTSIAHTYQLAHALMAANKDFDMLILPNRPHGLRFDPYFTRRRWDYLVENLLGVKPPETDLSLYR